ncbi:MAG: manganese catalase family protein [Clostridia bacterium]|nr:manganese catalase family protein [Clostridia bacterium]
MWIYEKKLQYPVKIKNPNLKLAQIIISQLGGPDGELAASMRYLHQRYACPYDKITGLLTDIGTEELAHLEIIAAILYQLTRNLSEEEIAESPFATYFVDHTTGLYPVAASGVPFDMKYVGVKGDILTDLNEDLAADAAIPQTQPLSQNRRKPL